MCALVMSMTVLVEKRFVYYRRQDGVPVDVALNEDISDRMLLSVLIPGFLLRNETGSRKRETLVDGPSITSLHCGLISLLNYSCIPKLSETPDL